METDGVLAEINLEAFTECIGGQIEEVLKKNEKSHEKKMMNQVSELKKLANTIKLEELLSYKKLGYGQFGSVYLVRHKSHEQFFALKCISKQQVVEQSLEKHIQVLEILRIFFNKTLIARESSIGNSEFPLHYAVYKDIQGQ